MSEDKTTTETIPEEQEDAKVVEPEIVTGVPVLSRPSLPVSIDELSNLEGEGGLEVIRNRQGIVENLRRASIALTYPQDWLLFRTNEGAVTGFCQDSGCKRFWQMWGIEIIPRGGFELIKDDEDPGKYAIRCVADGYSKVTGTPVENVEGVRYSDEDFCKDLDPLKKKIRVQQASIANRDGNIIRALVGMKTVAVELLEDVWKGTGKDIKKCSYGKGFGSKAERMGAQVQQADDLKPGEEPTCDKCSWKMTFVPAGKSKRTNKPYAAFWTCKNKQCDFTIQHAEVLKRVEMDRRDAAEAEPVAEREPGQEG